MKTAVEWLEFRYKNNINLMDYDFEQAKEMENEQQAYSKEKVDKLLDTLLHYNMCSVAGDELIEKFKNK